MRAAERKELRDIVDTARLAQTTSVDEILAMVEDADRYGPFIGAQARVYATDRLRELARLENKRNILNGRGQRKTIDAADSLLAVAASKHAAATQDPGGNDARYGAKSENARRGKWPGGTWDDRFGLRASD
jgi:hypothetical protein